jgi:hypothetical protein
MFKMALHVLLSSPGQDEYFAGANSGAADKERKGGSR